MRTRRHTANQETESSQITGRDFVSLEAMEEITKKISREKVFTFCLKKLKGKEQVLKLSATCMLGCHHLSCMYKVYANPQEKH